MRGTCFLVAGLAFVIVIAEVSANCLCGVTGEDYCSCKSIRPIPRLLEKSAGPPPKLSPIGDRCWCGKQLVEPAIPPKPCCPKKLPKVYVKQTCHSCGAEKVSDNMPCSCGYGCGCGCGCGCASKYPVPEASPPRKCSGLPADPVSISLAYQMDNTKKCAAPESKLQYGFRTIPLNGIPKVTSSNCPEEDLYALKRQIIELKKNTASNHEEELFEEESEESDMGPDPSYLTYGDLGYCPDKFKGGKFIGVPVKTPDIPIAAPSPQFDCGFKTGRIVPYNTQDPRFKYGPCPEDEDQS